MKRYNEKHDVVLNSDFKLVETGCDLENGQIVPHREIVEDIFFYVNYGTNEVPVYTKIWLNKNFIVDIYNQITEVEKNIIDAPYDNLPF